MILISMQMITPSISFTIRSTNSSLSGTDIFNDYLYTSSPNFNRPYSRDTDSYHYKMIKLTVSTSGQYTLTSAGSFFDTYGCLYDTFFNPSNPYDNLIGYDDDGAGDQQFQINHYLQSGTTYILIVTSSSGYITGRFRITASGIGSPSLIIYPSRTRSELGSLTSRNPTFSRPGGLSSNYYYDSYHITVSTTGTYSLKSSNSYSTDVYGCLYRTTFDSSSPSMNLIECDDDSGVARQFLLRQNLYSSTGYILVVTTSFSYSTGSYWIDVEGPSSVSIFEITPYDRSGLIGGVIGGIVCLLVVIIIIVFLVHRYRKQKSFRQTPTIAQYNPNAAKVVYPNVHQNPYTIPPPSNNVYMISPSP